MWEGGRWTSRILIADGVVHAGFGRVGLDSITAGASFSTEDSASDDEAMIGGDCGRASMGTDARKRGARRERCGGAPSYHNSSGGGKERTECGRS